MTERADEPAVEGAKAPIGGGDTFAPRARALLVLAASVFSPCLASTQLVASADGTAFVVANQTTLPARLAALGASALLGLLVAAGAFFFCLRRADFRPLTKWSRLAAPLVVSAFVPVLFAREAWTNREIAYFVYLLAVGLAFERTTSVAAVEWASRSTSGSSGFFGTPRALRVRRWLPLGIVLLAIGAYVARVGHLTNVSHVKLMTMSSDLAEYDNMFFNALHGHPFRSPAIAGHLNDWNTLQGHAEFGLYLLLPFYALSPGAHALLWIQTAIVAATALPVFLLGRLRLGALGGLCFVTVYLTMPAVQQPNFYDFHFTPLGMFFVSWTLFFAALLAENPAARRSRVGLYVSMALALLCREDVSIGIAVLGVYLALSGALVTDGLRIAVIAGIYFVAMKFGIMPLFGRWWFDNMYDDLKAPGAQGFGAVVLTLISNPAFVLRSMATEPKFLYVLHMTVPLLALWLRRPLLWLCFLPGLVATLLVTNRPPMFQASFQYTYFWVPYVVAAAIVATRRGARGTGTLAALVLVAFSLSHRWGVFPTGEKILGGFVEKTFEVTPAERDRYEQLREIVSLIPPDAVVTVTEAEGPHVSSRLIMYSMKYTLGPDPEYLLVSHPRHRAEADHLRKALESDRYGVVAVKGPFVLAKRGADPAKNEVLWKKLGERAKRSARP